MVTSPTFRHRSIPGAMAFPCKLPASQYTHTHMQSILCILIALHMHNGYALRLGINKLTVCFPTNSISELSIRILIETIWRPQRINQAAERNIWCLMSAA